MAQGDTDTEPDEGAAGSRLLVHIGLFLATCGTTMVSGYLNFGTWAAGASFAATLLGILMCHEMGHYLVARRYHIGASLPYFVPLPPGISLGTLGAIIRMPGAIPDRNQLIDVGAAGPFAGLVVAIPLLMVGLSYSELAPITEDAMLEGNSLLYMGIKYLVFGQVLPSAEGWDVQLHPMAFAAWVGLLVTMINLIPIGQLDGGHIACAALGDEHESSSRLLHKALVVMAVLVFAAMMWEAYRAGRGTEDMLVHGASGGLPWLVWAVLLVVMRRMSGGIYHPPVGEQPLTPGRKVLVFFTLIVFLALLTPVPFRPALLP